MKLETVFWYCLVVAMNAYLHRVPAETLTSLQTAFLAKFPVMFQVLEYTTFCNRMSPSPSLPHPSCLIAPS